MISFTDVLHIPPIISRLALLSPESESAQLIRALDAYLDSKPVELIERCNFSRQEINTALAQYQTRAGRLRALDRLLTEKGIPA